ncbi:hypothetical protein Hanom_Chr08g00726971 [Helianthus anomalus]
MLINSPLVSLDHLYKQHTPHLLYSTNKQTSIPPADFCSGETRRRRRRRRRRWS